MEQNITLKRLKELVSYDQETGAFTWVARGRGIRTGRRAGSIEQNGYRYLRLDGADYLAQRLAWLWVHGVWPRLIRFQDGNRDNCAIDNLREGFYISTKHDHRTPEGRAAYGKAWRAANPDRAKEHELLKDFGMTLAEYSAMHLAQGGVCAICAKPETETRQGKLRALAVDHDHETGAVRELLCTACNKLIGLAADDRNILLAAVRYLDKHSSREPAIALALVKERS